jgi:phage terminase large subunit
MENNYLDITFQQKQRLAFETSLNTPITFYGGSRGGGKSYLVRAREVIRRLTNTNTRGLIIRKTFPELIANHIRPFFTEYPETRKWYNKQEKTIYYPNGSTTEFSYLQSPDDVYNYQGREYEDISVDEVTQHEYETIRILRASNRTTNPKIKPTMFLTGNPGGLGHAEVKRLFVDKMYRPGERPDDYAFVQAKVWDNEALMTADPDYIERLKQLPDYLRKAYLDGDWNIFAGAAFTEMSRDIHLVEPFELNSQAKYFAGYDWGYAHPFAFILFAIQPDGQIYCTNFAQAHKKDIPEQARLIHKIVGDMKINVYAGTDIWAHRGGPMIVDQLRQELPNLTFVQAYTDRVHRVAKLRELLAYQHTKSGNPKLKFFKNTEPVYDCIAGMQHSDRKPEDVLKVDANEWGQGGDDLYDAAGYALVTWLRAPKEKPPEKPVGQTIIEEIVKKTQLRQQHNYW